MLEHCSPMIAYFPKLFFCLELGVGGCLTPVHSHAAAGASWWMASVLVSCFATLRPSLIGSDAYHSHWACWSENRPSLLWNAAVTNTWRLFCVMPGIQTQVLQLPTFSYSVIIPMSCRVDATAGIHLWCQQGAFILSSNIRPLCLKIFSAPLPTIAVLVCFILTT